MAACTPAPKLAATADYEFGICCKWTVFKNEEIKGPYDLLTICHKFGLLFVGAPSSIKAILLNNSFARFKYDEVENFLCRSLTLSSTPRYIDVNSDEEFLAVVTTYTDSPVLLVYSISSFFAEEITVLYVVRLNTERGDYVTDLSWNPAVNNMLACCISNGSLNVYTFSNSGGFEINALAAASKSTCICWSRKGKQIVVGDQFGSLIQYKPDLKATKKTPPPKLSEDIVTVLNVKWLSDYQFLVVYNCQSQDKNTPYFVIVNSKKNEINYVNYNDFAIGHPSDNKIYIAHQRNWNILLIYSQNSYEVNMLDLQEDGITWNELSLDEEKRVALPFGDGGEQSKPIGMIIDCCDHFPDGPLHNKPLLWILTNTGFLWSHTIINSSANADNINFSPHCILEESLLKNFVWEGFDETEQGDLVYENVSDYEETTDEYVTDYPNDEVYVYENDDAYNENIGSSQFLEPSQLDDGQQNGGVTTGVVQNTMFSIDSIISNNFSSNNENQQPEFTESTKEVRILSSPKYEHTVPEILKEPDSSIQISTDRIKADEQIKQIASTLAAFQLKQKGIATSKQDATAAALKAKENYEETLIAKVKEQIASFNNELAESKRSISDLNNLTIKGKASFLSDTLRDLVKFANNLKDATDSLKTDVKELKLQLLQSFKQCNRLQQIYNDVNNTGWIACSPKRNANFMAIDVVKKLYNNFNLTESYLHRVDNHIDEIWYNFEECQSKKRVREQLDVIYETLSTQRNIVNKEKEIIDHIQTVFSKISSHEFNTDALSASFNSMVINGKKNIKLETLTKRLFRDRENPRMKIAPNSEKKNLNISNNRSPPAYVNHKLSSKKISQLESFFSYPRKYEPKMSDSLSNSSSFFIQNKSSEKDIDYSNMVNNLDEVANRVLKVEEALMKSPLTQILLQYVKNKNSIESESDFDISVEKSPQDANQLENISKTKILQNTSSDSNKSTQTNNAIFSNLNLSEITIEQVNPNKTYPSPNLFLKDFTSPSFVPKTFVPTSSPLCLNKTTPLATDNSKILSKPAADASKSSSIDFGSIWSIPKSVTSSKPDQNLPKPIISTPIPSSSVTIIKTAFGQSSVFGSSSGKSGEKISFNFGQSILPNKTEDKKFFSAINDENNKDGNILKLDGLDKKSSAPILTENKENVTGSGNLYEDKKSIIIPKENVTGNLFIKPDIAKTTNVSIFGGSGPSIFCGAQLNSSLFSMTKNPSISSAAASFSFAAKPPSDGNVIADGVSIISNKTENSSEKDSILPEQNEEKETGSVSNLKDTKIIVQHCDDKNIHDTDKTTPDNFSDNSDSVQSIVSTSEAANETAASSSFTVPAAVSSTTVVAADSSGATVPTLSFDLTPKPDNVVSSIFGNVSISEVKTSTSTTTAAVTTSSSISNAFATFSFASKTGVTADGTSSIFKATPTIEQNLTQTATTTSSIFGQSSTSSTTGGSLFAQTPSIFGSPQPATTLSSATTIIFTSAQSTSTSSSIFSPTTITTASGTLFGQPQSTDVFGSAQQPSTATAAAVSSGIFTSPQSSPTSNIFGTNTTPSTNTSSIFGQPQTSGNLFSQSTSNSLFGQNSTSGGGIFGQSANSSSSPFGSPPSSTFDSKPLFGGNTSFFAPQAQKPFDANRPLFGGTATFGQPSQFSTNNTFQGQSFFSNTGTSSQVGFGSPSSFGTSAFASTPAFGSQPAFGSSATFGAPSAFGGSPTKAFGQTSPSAGGFGSIQQNATFENLAKENTIGFGNLAAQQPQQGFGFSNPSTTNQPFGGSSFSGWR